MARRTVLIQFDPNLVNPEKRTNFRHPNLEQWVAENRNGLIHAILVLAQSWISAGKVPFSKTKASFESWSSVLGGILTHAGFVGFLDETTEDAMVVTDLPRAEGEEFVEAWFQAFSYRAVAAKDLLKLAAPPEVFSRTTTRDDSLVRAAASCTDRFTAPGTTVALADQAPRCTAKPAGAPGAGLAPLAVSGTHAVASTCRFSARFCSICR